MKTLNVVMLTSVLLAAPLCQALAESCTSNFSGGYDCRYDDGTTSTSSANFRGGWDTRYSDGRTSTSSSNFRGGWDTSGSNGSRTSTSPNYSQQKK